MKNQVAILIIMGIVLAGLILWLASKPEPKEELIGGQTDEHGCLIAAGYSWSEEKQKCVRPWEEVIIDEAEREVKAILAEKYGKNLDEVKTEVTKLDDNHVAGNVTFDPSGQAGGGLFLAYKEGQEWLVVYDGNGSVDCQKMRGEYGFSDLILSPQFCD